LPLVSYSARAHYRAGVGLFGWQGSQANDGNGAGSQKRINPGVVDKPFLFAGLAETPAFRPALRVAFFSERLRNPRPAFLYFTHR